MKKSILAIGLLVAAATVQAGGRLRAHSNPIYFTDDTGKAIYMGGHQGYWDLQDHPFNGDHTWDGQTTLNWPWYLNYLDQTGMNYIRNWTEFTTSYDAGLPLVDPMPYLRSNVCCANDGGNKFDLTKFNPAFFSRMRTRAQDLQNQGVYWGIMLWEVYAFGYQGGTVTTGFGNVFFGQNNINGVNIDRNDDEVGTEFFFSPTAQEKAIQRAYVNEVIKTVTDLDSVFFEIANELGACDWQEDLVNYIRDFEAGNIDGVTRKRHMVYWSWGGYMGPDVYPGYIDCGKDRLLASQADLVSPSRNGWGGDMYTDPPINNWGKPAILDMDHILPDVITPVDHPWKAFTRGYHYGMYEATTDSTGPADLLRKNIGAVNNYANVKFNDLSKMNPSTSISNTGYALANPGNEYLIFQGGSGQFTANIAAGTYTYEWFRPQTLQVVESGSITLASGNQTFTPPFSGFAVLYFRKATATVSRCDLDGNGTTEVLDVQRLINAVLANSTAAANDINRDGIINVLDAQILVNVVLQLRTCPS